MAHGKGSLGSAILWMFLLSILLFWLPLLGPLVAGFVGGRKAGDVGNAILAVILPAVVFSALVFVFGSGFFFLPFLGFLAGFGVLILALIHAVPLLIGAVIGGATA